jgi:hypothetical protein
MIRFAALAFVPALTLATLVSPTATVADPITCTPGGSWASESPGR